jgi:hypothetical protein
LKRSKTAPSFQSVFEGKKYISAKNRGKKRSNPLNGDTNGTYILIVGERGEESAARQATNYYISYVHALISRSTHFIVLICI